MKRQIALNLREKEEVQADKDENHGFIIHFQQSILLSLLKQKKLTQWQFERCMELLNRHEI